MDLVDTIHNYLTGLDETALAPFLEVWPLKPFKTRIVSHSCLPVLSYLHKIVTGADNGSKKILKKFQAQAEHFAWQQTYSTDDFGAAFLKKYGWTELIGRRGPIASREIACGFLMLGPDIEYPMHSHEAKEIYVPLSRQSHWRKGNGSWISKPCGVPVYHKPWQPHGMRTTLSPLLALYLWRGGDLTQKSHINRLL